MARDITPEKEAKTAKLVSLVVKFGALLFIVFLPTQYAIDLQLLGGVWILQIFPAIVFSLYTRRLNTSGLFPWLACGDRAGYRIGHCAGPEAGLRAPSGRRCLSGVYRADCAGGEYRREFYRFDPDAATRAAKRVGVL